MSPGRRTRSARPAASSSVGAQIRREGVSGRLVLDAVPEPTRRIWAPTLEDAAGLALRVLRPGDTVVTLGVGEPWRAARAIVDGLAGPDES